MFQRKHCGRLALLGKRVTAPLVGEHRRDEVREASLFSVSASFRHYLNPKRDRRGL